MDKVKHPVGEAGKVIASTGRRLGVTSSGWLDDWYCSYSPRNCNECAEGTWAEWVELAKEIIKLDKHRSDSDG